MELNLQVVNNDCDQPASYPRAGFPAGAPKASAGADGATELPSSVQHAVNVLEVESTALRLLATALADGGGSPFEQAVDTIGRCAGRCVVSGMGKSGLIGRKIAATLASTGTPAYFVHPAEASHGDLGMIAPGDVVIGLSNSGETPELGDLLAYTERLDIPLVAMTSRAGSTLGRRADILLLLPGAPEACPLGLAPTTSTTMMLALGDALAIALMERKRFTPLDFRSRHPGGKLGRRLTRVEELIRPSDSLPLVHLDAPMGEVFLAMGRTGYGTAGVIDDHGDLVGMITEADLRRHMGPDLLHFRAGEIMSEAPVHIRPDMSATEALHVMSSLDVSNVFVTEGSRPIGILHIGDCRRVEAA